MEARDFIINTIQSMTGKYTPYQIFSDWVAMVALATQNQCVIRHNDLWKKREQQYLDIAKKYSRADLDKFAEMLANVIIAFDGNFDDVLGDIFMRSGCGSKSTGQFFTPYHLSALSARAAYAGTIKEYAESGKVLDVYEPAAGAGGMIIAVAEEMKKQGINYQKKLHVVAQDIDWNGVYMTYIQLSFLGIKATVVQGDTLSEPYRGRYDPMRVLRTPAEMGMIL